MALFDYYSVSIGEWIQADTATGTYRVYADETLTDLDETSVPFSTEDLLIAQAIAPAPPPEVVSLDTLNAALITLRAATADRLITPSEAAALETVVIPALETLRDTRNTDPEALYLTSLVLAQIIQAVYAVVKQQSAALQGTASSVGSLTSRVTTLEIAVAALQTPPPPAE